jgi:hypothetical protein
MFRRLSFVVIVIVASLLFSGQASASPVVKIDTHIVIDSTEGRCVLVYGEFKVVGSPSAAIQFFCKLSSYLVAPALTVCSLNYAKIVDGVTLLHYEDILESMAALYTANRFLLGMNGATFVMDIDKLSILLDNRCPGGFGAAADGETVGAAAANYDVTVIDAAGSGCVLRNGVQFFVSGSVSSAVRFFCDLSQYMVAPALAVCAMEYAKFNGYIPLQYEEVVASSTDLYTANVFLLGTNGATGVMALNNLAYAIDQRCPGGDVAAG